MKVEHYSLAVKAVLLVGYSWAGLLVDCSWVVVQEKVHCSSTVALLAFQAVLMVALVLENIVKLLSSYHFVEDLGK